VVILFGVLAVVPVLGVAALSIDAGRRGTLKVNAPAIYALAALLALLLGVAAGALGSIPGVLEVPEGSSINANIFFLGVSHAVVLAGVIAALGGVHWWAVKIGRGPANDKAGMLAPVLLLVGTAVAVIPDLVSGIAGEGIETYGDYTGGISGMNVVAAIGVSIVALGLLVAVVSLLPLLRTPDGEVPADPWGGQTLEWATASPPSPGNFDDELAVVTSAEPLIDLREEK
jgi:heme/copper-type cytochrome/quinol oxidase subunit 1